MQQPAEQGAGDEPDWDAVVPYAGPPSYPAGPPQVWPQPPYPQSPYPQSPYPQSPYPAAGYPSAGYGAPAYGYPPTWGAPPGAGWAPLPPRGPQRPGTTVAAAVVAFALAALTLVGTVYAMAFSALLAVTRHSTVGLGPWIALVQLAVVALLVTGGVLVLSGRRRWLLVAVAAEVALAVYWLGVLGDLAPTALGSGVLSLPLVFGVLAAVSAGLTFVPASLAWERAESARRATARAASGPGRGNPGA